jgi:hypothetical protein
MAKTVVSVSTRDLGAIRDVPWAVLFDDRRELVVHSSILTPIDTCNARTPAWFSFSCGRFCPWIFHIQRPVPFPELPRLSHQAAGCGTGPSRAHGSRWTPSATAT